jgi:hypothetical protein
MQHAFHFIWCSNICKPCTLLKLEAFQVGGGERSHHNKHCVHNMRSQIASTPACVASLPWLYCYFVYELAQAGLGVWRGGPCCWPAASCCCRC